MSSDSERHPLSQHFTFEGMTVPEVHRELLSVDDLYQAGFSVDLKHPNRNDGPPDLYKPATHNSPESRLPLSYDWSGNGGFRLYYRHRGFLKPRLFETTFSCLRDGITQDVIIQIKSGLFWLRPMICGCHSN